MASSWVSAGNALGSHAGRLGESADGSEVALAVTRMSWSVSSALSFLYCGVGTFLFGLLCPVAVVGAMQREADGDRQIDGDQVGERLVRPSTLVTMIDATARQRHIDDSGSGGRRPFASIWLPVGQAVDRRGMGAKEVLGWDGTDVGGCGSGLVLNGQECWRGTGVCGCVEGSGVGVGGRRSGVEAGRQGRDGGSGGSSAEVAWGGQSKANKNCPSIHPPPGERKKQRGQAWHS